MKVHHIVLTCAVAWVAVGCGEQKEATHVATEVTAVRRATVVLDPTAAEWRALPEFTAPLVPQDMVEPRLTTPSTKEVRVQAMTDGTRIAFRLAWSDETRNDVPGVGRFSDACAVQLPARIEADVPAPQMGEGGKRVEITYWRAFWQSMVDGRADTVKALYPGAQIDHYPFEAPSLGEGSPDQQAMAKRYAPARALENHMAGPRVRPVEDLIAEGPGTITPAKEQSDGRGTHVPDGWVVVLVRPLPQGLTGQTRGQVAFAVWNGEQKEGGARKMRSVWVPLVAESGK